MSTASGGLSLEQPGDEPKSPVTGRFVGERVGGWGLQRTQTPFEVAFMGCRAADLSQRLFDKLGPEYGHVGGVLLAVIPVQRH